MANYIKGVYEKGQQVIRPLTEEEKDWLYKFNKEYEYTNIEKDGSDLHAPLFEANKVRYEELEKEWKEVYHTIKNCKEQNFFKMSKEDKKIYLQERKVLRKRKQDIEDEMASLVTPKQMYNKDYAKRMDISNYNLVSKVSDINPRSFFFESGNYNVDSCPEWELFDKLKSLDNS